MSVVVKLNRAGAAELLRSPEVAADLARRARTIAAAAGEGMEVQSFTGRARVRATVRTGTMAARRAEAEHRVLSSAIDAGRG